MTENEHYNFVHIAIFLFFLKIVKFSSVFSSISVIFGISSEMLRSKYKKDYIFFNLIILYRYARKKTSRQKMKVNLVANVWINWPLMYAVLFGPPILLVYKKIIYNILALNPVYFLCSLCQCLRLNFWSCRVRQVGCWQIILPWRTTSINLIKQSRVYKVQLFFLKLL